MPQRTLGQVMHAMLDREGITLTQLAETTGIERSHLSRIASDAVGLGAEKLPKLADALGLDHGYVARAAARAAANRREARERANDGANVGPDPETADQPAADSEPETSS